MSEWKEKPLSDLAILYNDSWKVGDEECPYIALEHIEEGKLRLNRIGYSDSVASNKYRFNGKNFLFGKLRPYFRKVVRPQFSGICSTDIWVVGARGETDLIFLFYLFANQEFVDLAYSGSSGTRMPRADWKFMKDTVWLIPSDIEEQRAIASVLSSLDDKIDLLHRQNETLEAIAETLFRQWFVEGADEGWDTKISELPIEIIDGDRGKNYPKNSELLDVGDCLFLSAKNVTKNGFNFYQCQFITAEKDVLLRSGKLNRNDIVITTRGTVGNVAYYDDLIGYTDIRINSGMIIIRTVSSVMDSIFIFCLIRSNYLKSLIENQTSGSAQPQLPIRDFKQIDVYYPPKEKVDEFLVFAKPCLNKKFYNDSQIEKLEKLRDMLLPKLMSGKVRVEI